MIALLLLIVMVSCNKPRIDEDKFYSVYYKDNFKGDFKGDQISYHGDLLCYYDKLYSYYYCWPLEDIEIKDYLNK